MKTLILVATSVVVLFGAVKVSAEQQVKSVDSSPENSMPEAIACAQDLGDAFGHCRFLIKRDGNGTITVTVVFANGFKRKLIFKDGSFLKGNATMSGVGTDTDWSLKDGIHMIRVDDQRYNVPAALITGN